MYWGLKNSEVIQNLVSCDFFVFLQGDFGLPGTTGLPVSNSTNLPLYFFSLEPLLWLHCSSSVFVWYFRGPQVCQDYRVTEDSTDQRSAHNNKMNNTYMSSLSLNWIYLCFLTRAHQVTQVPEGKRSDKTRIFLQQSFDICLRGISINGVFSVVFPRVLW